MKTRLLTVIGILIVITMPLSYYAIYNSSDIFISCNPEYEQIDGECLLKTEQYCKDWCDPQKLFRLGCDDLVIDYIYRATNLFDEEFGDIHYRDLIGLPEGVSEEEFEKCTKIIHEKRTSADLEKNTDPDEIEILQISKNKIISKGTGFDLPEDSFTKEDLKKLEQREKELRKIRDNSDTSYEQRQLVSSQINEMQDRLQYPFQTGVPYPLFKAIQERFVILESNLENAKKEVHYSRLSSSHISSEHHALRIGIHPDYFSLSELEYQDKKVREYLGNEMNILYEAVSIRFD